MSDEPAQPENEPPAKRRWYQSRRSVLLCILLGSLIIFCLLAYEPVAQWYTSSSGEHLTVEEATERGLRLHVSPGGIRAVLPAEASDIRFDQHTHPDHVISVNFAISEKGFLDWAGGWPLIKTEAGYFYTTSSRGRPNAFSYSYDRKTSRAYYNFHSRPHYGEK